MILYGAYHTSTEFRTCVGNTVKTLLMVNSDLDYIRDCVNQYFSTLQCKQKYGTTIVIPVGELKSNVWCNGLGGAQSTGYIIIEIIPTNLDYLNEHN